MNDKWLAFLDALDRLGGKAPLSEVRAEAGVTIKDINNSLRTLAPEYIETVGYLEQREWYGGGQPPKILRLTEAGAAKAQDSETEIEADRIHELEGIVNDLAERVRRGERRVQEVREHNKRLEKMILYLDDEQ